LSQFTFQSVSKVPTEYIISYTDQGVMSISEEKILKGLPSHQKQPIMDSEWLLDSTTILNLLMDYDQSIIWPSDQTQELILEHDQVSGVLSWKFYTSPNLSPKPKYVVDPINGNITIP
jgi:hypothetical protein